MGETVTVKWANSCLYFLCRANPKIKLSSQLCRKTFSPRTNEIKMAEVAQRDVFSPFPLVVAMRVFCWRWMPGRLAASVRAAQMRFTVETERKKEILLASQHECGWLLIEWRGCFVLLLQWKSCTRRKAIYALQRGKKGKKKHWGCLEQWEELLTSKAYMWWDSTCTYIIYVFHRGAPVTTVAWIPIFSSR